MNIKEIPLEDIGLSVRSFHVLKRGGVNCIGDLLEQTECSLRAMRNMGRKSMEEVLAIQEEYRSKVQPELSDLTAPAEMVPNDDIVAYLKSQNTKIEALDLLSPKAYNLLTINGFIYLHQIAFLSAAKLEELLPIDEITAQEIARRTEEYISEHRNMYQQKYLETKQMEEWDPAADQKHRPKILEYLQANDQELSLTNLPNRAIHSLQKNNYTKFSQIAFLPCEAFYQMGALGKTSVDRIMELIHQYFTDNKQHILAYLNGDLSALIDERSLRKAILKLYHSDGFRGYSFSEFKEALQLPVPDEQLKKAIGGLLKDKELEYVDFRCYRVYDSFAKVFPLCTEITDRSKDIITRRMNGETLEEAAKPYGITRERVRQLVKKDAVRIKKWYTQQTGKLWLDEEYYEYFYKTYQFEKEDAEKWFGIPKYVWKYLNALDIKQGKQDVQLALEDTAHLDAGLRLKVKNYLNRNKIYVDDRWVERKRADLEEVVARKFCRTAVNFAEFYDIYNQFLSDEGIPYDDSIYYTEDVIRTRKNRLVDVPFLLTSIHEEFRYYDIGSRDYSELAEELALDSYENIEISTLKLFEEHPELMDRYDIQNHYELHNLLKKVFPEGSFHGYHANKTPILQFGKFDRLNQIRTLLLECAPIEFEDFMTRIRQEYGYEIGAVPLKKISSYYHQGVYRIPENVMNDDKKARLHQALPEDFYYISEIRDAYENLFPDGDVQEINSYNLKEMGFHVLSNYAIQHYPSLEAYFNAILTEKDMQDVSAIRKRYARVVSFSQVWVDLKRKLEILEYEPNKIIHIRKLEKCGMGKEQIREFSQAIYDFTQDGEYFSARSIRRDGFQSPLYDLGFEDWFYGSVLISDSRFSYAIMFGTPVLYRGKENISIQSFLVNMIQKAGKMDIYDLMTDLHETYGCRELMKSDVLTKLQGTAVYYDHILERLYANEEIYYRELDEMEGV